MATRGVLYPAFDLLGHLRPAYKDCIYHRHGFLHFPPSAASAY